MRHTNFSFSGDRNCWIKYVFKFSIKIKAASVNHRKMQQVKQKCRRSRTGCSLCSSRQNSNASQSYFQTIRMWAQVPAVGLAEIRDQGSDGRYSSEQISCVSAQQVLESNPELMLIDRSTVAHSHQCVCVCWPFPSVSQSEPSQEVLMD